MSIRSLDKKVAGWMEISAAVILIGLPFHAFMTVWLSSLVGHYTLLRLWKEFLLTGLVLGALFFIFRDANLRRSLFRHPLIRIMCAYLILLGIAAGLSLAFTDTSSRAIWYGLLVDSRFLIFFIVIAVTASRRSWLMQKWKIWLMVPAILVAAIAVLQYLVLPYNILSHFGYGASTIEPYETINSNLNHIRVFSTLRGANPLGAYLLLPLTILVAALINKKKERKNELLLGVGIVLALIFSFSRSAWIGAVLSAGIAAWLSMRSNIVKTRLVLVLAWVAVVTVAISFVMKDNSGFENIFLHTESGSVNVSSNEGHFSAFKNAIVDIVHEPMGAGVGTAGPQSTYNVPGGTRISENYYLQIGQEVGILGGVLFIGVIIMMLQILWDRRTDLLHLSLFASLVGLSITNLFLHAWADDTLAYVWWGLAGIALSPAILGHKDKRDVKN